MAFTQDGISYIGTDGRDSLVLTTGVGNWEFPTGGPAYIEALGDDDQVTFNGNAAEVTLVAGDGNDVTLISGGGVTGQLAASSINGNAGDDRTTWLNITNSSIYGGQGNDFLASRAGQAGLTTNASEINGNKGDDTISLTGSVTFTSVYGGQGDDTVFFAPTNAAINNLISGNKGNDTVNVTITTAGSGGNSVYGGQGNDTILAGASTAALFISGDLGNDNVTGGAGDDTIDGGAGFDTLLGGAGADTIDGGDDADILNGGVGADTLTGGASADRFVFANFAAADTVTDFVSGAIGGGLSDRLSLDVTSGTAATNGVGALSLLQRAGNGQLRITAVANVASNSQMAYTRTVAMGTSIRNPLFNGANLAAVQAQITGNGQGIAVTATAMNNSTVITGGVLAGRTALINAGFVTMIGGDTYSFLAGNQVRRVDNLATVGMATSTFNNGGFFALGRTSNSGNLYKLEGSVAGAATMIMATVAAITNTGVFTFTTMATVGGMITYNYALSFAGATGTAMASNAVTLNAGRTRTIAQVDGAFSGSDIFIF